MGMLYTIQPEDREPVEFTHFDCWEDDETESDITLAWSSTLGFTLPDRIEDAILSLLRKGYDVYEGDSFIEIYEGLNDE